MSNLRFGIKKHFCSSEAFAEATEQELRVLLAVIELDGEVSEKQLSGLAGVSLSRCKSSIAFWQSAGVLFEKGENTVTEEFEERIHTGELYEQSASEVASGIRDKGLGDLFIECAEMLGKHELTPMEVNRITRLSLQYSLSAEYIATLAAHLAEKGNFSVNLLVRRGIKLADEGIDSTELLEKYISEKMSEDASMLEIRRVLGIYGRKLSPTENKYIKKWTEEYGYYAEIINEAYDITTLNTGGTHFPYIDKILTDWHGSGVKTVEDCVARRRDTQAEWEAQAEKIKGQGSRSKKPSSSKSGQRHGDFDPEEALKRALERSFFDDVTPEENERN